MTVKLGSHREPVHLASKAGSKQAWASWACADCGAVYASGTAEQTARQCCAEMLCECGQPVRKHYTLCDACLRQSAKAAELERYEKAEKIPWQKYQEDEDAQIFSPVTEEFYPDADTLLDCEDDPLGDPTPWAWACTVKKLHVDARDVTGMVMDGHHEEAYVGDEATEELQVLLDGWCAKQNVETFFPDYTRAVTFGDLVQERLDDLDLDEDEVSEGK